MSRCVAFPPPGYVWNGVSGEALVQILKLRRESAEAEKREEKRWKKEKKKERKNSEVRRKRTHQRGRHKDKKSNKGPERSDNQKKREYETKSLENSSLTEELGQPMESDSLYDSSDNSRSIKRKKHSWSFNECHKPGMLLQKLKDQELLLTSKSSYSPSTMTDFVASEEDDTPPTSNFNEICSLQIETQLRKLIINWVPLPLSIQNEQTDFDDQAWLHERGLPRSKTNGVHISSNEDFLFDGSSTQFPYARSLPDADTYALPFVMPF